MKEFDGCGNPAWRWKNGEEDDEVWRDAELLPLRLSVRALFCHFRSRHHSLCRPRDWRSGGHFSLRQKQYIFDPLQSCYAAICTGVSLYVQYYQSSPVTLNSPLLRFSASHLSNQAFIRSRLFWLPTLTVGMIRPIRNAQQNIVNSRNELCSL